MGEVYVCWWCIDAAFLRTLLLLVKPAPLFPLIHSCSSIPADPILRLRSRRLVSGCCCCNVDGVYYWNNESKRVGDREREKVCVRLLIFFFFFFFFFFLFFFFLMEIFYVTGFFLFSYNALVIAYGLWHQFDSGQFRTQLGQSGPGLFQDSGSVSIEPGFGMGLFFF